MLLGKIPGKSAAIMNFFVGAMQVVFPTIILSQANGDPAVILGASGLYLFGFTYLYVGLNQIFGLPGEGLGWFSLFVAFVAVVFGVLQFIQVEDPLFGVIWFLWAILWTLFFLLLALGKDSLNDFTGWFTIIRRAYHRHHSGLAFADRELHHRAGRSRGPCRDRRSGDPGLLRTIPPQDA